jgi:RNA polymerase sigma factor (TIGR02999 family)
MTILGEQNALLESELFAILYAELKQRAHTLLRRSESMTLDTTSLVHEVFIKLMTSSSRTIDKTHFFRLASLAMRQLLVDHLRERQTSKRGGGIQHIDIGGIDIPQEDPAYGLQVVVDALDRLRVIDERMADVFSLHAFAGLPFEDIAKMLGVSRPTAQRDFATARAYLLSTLD